MAFTSIFLQRASQRRSAAIQKAVLTSICLSAFILILTQVSSRLLILGPRDLNHGASNTDVLFAKREDSADKECRLVHGVPDKCAFVQKYCPDEEAGLISYLQLYFCKLPRAKPLAFTIMLLWLGLLFSTIGIAASDFFSVNLSTIASLLGLSESVAGVTFLAFGNGSPDVFSTFAAMSTNSGSLAIGELIGAAGFITAVVAGSMAIVRPFKVARKSFIRDVSFFVVAASFSMVFLADKHLAFWECTVMVIFYVAYVLVVVVWHWVIGRRRRRKQMEARAREHFMVPGYSDSPEEQVDDDSGEEARPPIGELRRSFHDDFAILETAGHAKTSVPDEEAQTEAREQWMSELSRNMRVQRPTLGSHRNTGNPIRPSLVGALEFRAVLSSLEKSRNQQAIPISIRRYSDDPTFTLAQQQQYHSRASSNPQIDHYMKGPGSRRANFSWLTSRNADYRPTRHRAVSANDAYIPQRAGGRIQHTDMQSPLPGANTTVPQSGAPTLSQGSLLVPGQGLNERERSPNAPSMPFTSPPDLSINTQQPQEDHSGTQSDFHLRPDSRPLSMHSIIFSPATAGSSPAIPFPPYHDDASFVAPGSRPHSIRLPPPSLDPGSFLPQTSDFITGKPLRWWPYKLLPPPSVLASTLFPTLYSWKEKRMSERLLGLVSAPTIFLLTITLPVVELEKDDGNVKASDTLLSSATPPRTPVRAIAPIVSVSLETEQMITIQDSSSEVMDSLPYDNGLATPDTQGSVSIDSEALPRLEVEPDASEPGTIYSEGWNRWLVSTQVFTAPFFLVLILWANMDDEHSWRTLLFYASCAMLGSLLIFAAIVFTTTENRTPRYRSVLCFVGFIVSIAWISTIASEVVGVLKALGVILGISDAILGLTIFAVGNSLGDLVANITVAKLGFPVMALSACFGGPMLNILLGIGLSGLYMTLKGDSRPGNKPPTSMKPQPYPIEVGGTLIISGITLLVTLLGLLVAVPLNKWTMDRKIGWSLVILWSLSTIANIVVEITGVTRRLS